MKTLLLIFILLSSFISFSQSLDTIQWRESYRLTWADFKGTPEPGRPEGAMTNAECFYSAKGKGKEIQCLVVCFFHRQGSWADEEHKNDYVLKHEQGHFDLYEISVRKFRKVLSEKTFHLETLVKELDKLAGKNHAEVEKEQDKFDKDTSFGVKEENQQRWAKKIAEDLQGLDQYKNTNVTLKVK